MASIDNVRFFRQHTSYSCGPASLKMVFDFFNLHEKEDLIMKQAKTTKAGTSHKNLIQAVRKNGFNCYVHDNSSINELKHFISRNLPVIVNYIEPSSDEGHYAVVIGYTNSSLILNDPWNGRNFRISQNNFLKRWTDKGKNNLYKNWLMVLSKKDFVTGKIYKALRSN